MRSLTEEEYEFFVTLKDMYTVNSGRLLQGFTGMDRGDTAWILTSSAIVLMMTIPGLALYYGGMVRTKNILACVMQVLSIACLITFLWLCFGYSLSFAPVNTTDMRHDYSNNNEQGNGNFIQVNAFLGDSSRFWLTGLTIDTFHNNAPSIPETVFCLYQLTFAIITGGLICGSVADRMKYSSLLVFITLWHICVYCPIAHWVWHPNGFLYKTGVLDFAGGTVVHICSGMSGLSTVMVLGNRKGFGKERFEPHNILYTVVGMSLIWVGWFG